MRRVQTGPVIGLSVSWRSCLRSPAPLDLDTTGWLVGERRAIWSRPLACCIASPYPGRTRPTAWLGPSRPLAISSEISISGPAAACVACDGKVVSVLVAPPHGRLEVPHHAHRHRPGAM